jgi:hypothetical protein
VGLPPGDIPLALFAFNAGVELGQLVFVAAVLGGMTVAGRTRVPSWLVRPALPLTARAIGIGAAFWFLERLAGFV